MPGRGSIERKFRVVLSCPPQPCRPVRRRPRAQRALLPGSVRDGVIAREPRANAAFLRLPRSDNHHDLGLFGIGTGAGPKRRGVGLYHLAWQVDTVNELASARDALLAAGAYTGESSHGATKSVYGADPDGNEFEIMWMLPLHAWGDYENAAPVDGLDLAGELRRWSNVRTAGVIVPFEDEVRS